MISLLKKQKIRSIEQIYAYKLPMCHTHSAGIDLGSAENYVTLCPGIAAEMDLPIVHSFIKDEILPKWNYLVKCN